MKSSEQIAKFRALELWFKQPQGKIVSLAMADELAKLPFLTRAGNLLQIGVCGSKHWFAALKNVNRWVLSPDLYNKNIDIVSPIDSWPLENQSIDSIFAPLTMEAMGSTDTFIHEIDRVLKPMGHVIIIGINSWSLWSFAAKTGLLSCFGEYPPSIHSPLSLNRKFSQLGYRQFLHKGFWYIPPIKTSAWLKSLNFLNETGKMLWPLPAGLYCFVAQKYQLSGLNPLVEEDYYEENYQKVYQKNFQPGLN